ncbi:type II toxin-antitoxin system prevent-host-death family antitoxin [Sphingomonas sp. KR1UV-12]|uniref:Type II toxin-antitoxin system prevent-host-death family antitoxin n=1 Tax=Sphingomonas aurea TaxID=3063994 RepID=A0ABT9EJP9_9SPHN|nr:type II toxin-antitoxin system prevent-host-death family antitoxin [Sphingomonas sp. KR1UV-12]MDP1027192.1 type II toxin-antitoxin system prevent-host-death family antitoxin [Sphingomonas sp. KR1UV-12]
MDAYSLSDADARLNDLVDRAAAGERVEIERGGRIVARVIPAGIEAAAETRGFDWRAYFESIKHFPFDPTNSVVEMRKEARY